MRTPIALVLGVLLLPALGLVGIGQAQAQPVAVASPVPIVGIVLGTIIVAGLLYLLVHGPDGGYYRYPYYGDYHRHYYKPYYRPYIGYYPALPPVIFVAPPIAGVVLGIIVVNNLQYILTRDAYGHVYRYPYYGPYRQYYYRSTYRPYAGPYVGAYRSATVRQGDPHWDAPAMRTAPHPGPQWQPGPSYQQPAPQRQPVSPDQHTRGPRDRQCQNSQSGQPCPDNGSGPHR